MPDERTIDLIHRRIDTVLEPSERAELDELLAGDAEAQMMAEELEQVSGFLSRRPAVEPPADVVPKVMTQVRQAATRKPVQFSERLEQRQRARNATVRWAFGIAAALAIAFLFVPSLRDSIDPRNAVGTMGQPQESVQTFPIAAQGLTGTIRLTTSSDRVVVAISFDQPANRQTRFTWDPAAVTPEGRQSNAAKADIASTGTTTELAFKRLSNQPTHIDVRIEQSGGGFFETKLNPGPSTNF